MSKADATRKSGFVALVGPPNAGKSTLINRLVGQKIAIISNKPQTTRTSIRGIVTRSEGQIVFLDTPGIHRPKHRLGEYMVDVAENSIREVDVALCVIDASHPISAAEQLVFEKIAKTKTPAMLALNKVDTVAKDRLLERIAQIAGEDLFLEIVPISARTGEQLPRLLSLLYERLPDGPFYYPEDIVTDHPDRMLVAELIREKVLQVTREEIPHSVAVEIDTFEYKEDVDQIHVYATIYTERNSQKGILIGKNGDLLKRVGTLARQDIEALFGSKTYLELWVKVKKDWRNQANMLRTFGFHQE